MSPFTKQGRVEMTHIPYRTGISTIRVLLTRVCSLIVRYEPVMEKILPDGQMVYVRAVSKACQDFILNVDNPRPE